MVAPTPTFAKSATWSGFGLPQGWPSRSTSRAPGALDLCMILLTAIGVLVAGLAAPKHNWDMVAYVAASYQAAGHGGEDLLDLTYVDVRREVDPASYRDLTAGTYRATVARDPVALEQQLPFYTIRVAFIAATRMVGALTGSYTRAAHLVATTFGVLSVLAMGFILLRIGVPAVVLPLLVSPVGILTLSRMATPDSMACFFSLLLIAALFRAGWQAYALIAVLPLIRSDYLIYSALAAAFLFFTRDRMRALAALATAGAAYAIIGRISGNYGYLNLLNFTFFGQQPYPAQMPISTDLGAYAAAIAEGTNYFVSDGVFVIYAMSLVLLWRRRAELGRDKSLTLLVLVPTLFSAGHFALFPSYDKRFLVSSFFLILAGLLKVLSETVRDGRRPSQGADRSR